jgi:hypothetical protein
MGVYTTLDTAQKLGAESVAIPLICNDPLDVCAKSLIANTIEWVTASDPSALKDIIICVSDPQAFQVV